MLGTRWRKILNDLWDNKTRSLLVVMSVAVGLIAFSGLLITRTVVISNLAAQFSASNPYDLLIELQPFDDELVRWASRQDNVIAAQGITVHTADMMIDGLAYNVRFFAFDDFNKVQINGIEPEIGDWPPERNEFLLERSYLSNINLAIGDEVVVEINNDWQHELRFVGTLHDINVETGIISTELKAYVTPRTLAEMGLSSRYNQLYLRINRPEVGVLGPTPGDIADKLRDDLRRLGVSVQSIQIKESVEHWAVDYLAGVVLILVVVGSAALLLSGFLVINTISGLLVQQKRQIGIMKIVGASRGQIIALYLALVTIFGGLALLITVPSSLILAWAISDLLGPQTLNFDIVEFGLPPTVLVIEIAVALLSPLLSALVPIFNGTGLSAAEAISDYTRQGRISFIDRNLAHIRGLPRPILLSLRNVFRRKVRLLLTLVTLSLAGALFTAIVNVRQTVQEDVVDVINMASFDVQLVFSQPYNRRGMERRALSIQGVADVEGWVSPLVTRMQGSRFESEELMLYGVPPSSIFIDPELIEGRWLEPMTRQNRFDIVVSDDLLSNQPEIQIGSIITLNHRGEKQDWRVVGIVDTMPIIGPGGVAYTYYDSVTRFIEAPEVITSLLVRTEQSSPDFQAEVAQALSQFFDQRDIKVAAMETNAGLIQKILGAFDIIIVLLMVTAIMIAIVGGLGLTGTMSLSVLERTREIGVMRSVGASTSTLHFMFILEGTVVGILSYIITIILSPLVTFAFGTILGETLRGKPLTFKFGFSGLVIWFIIVIFVSAVASILPAHRASQISIREALTYE